MKVSNLTIQHVRSQFDNWRANRSSRKVKFPKELRIMAVSLSRQEGYTTVRKVLGISGSQFKQWQSEVVTKVKLKSKTKSRSGKFITLPLVDGKSLNVTLAEPYCSDISLSCELIRADGTKMRVYVDQSNLNFVMNTFLGGQQ